MSEELINSTKTTEQIVDDFCLFDDTFMSKVFENNLKATQILVNIILERDDLKIISSIGQMELKSSNYGGRAIKLDILAEDEEGNRYNIEVQRDTDGADVHRARFNSSMVDVRMLNASDNFKILKDSFVIFITESDKLGKGLPLYHVDRIIKETGEPFNDGSHIIYVNGSYDDLNTPIGRLVHDFRCTKSSDVLYNEIAEQIRYFKETEGGRKVMCKLVEDYAEQCFEQKRLDLLYNDIKNAMESFKVTLVQAMDGLKVSDTDRAILAKRF